MAFGSLVDVLPRVAWSDEAREFTPWLASNLSRLGEVIGLELELIQAEAGLPTADDGFSADILARDLRSDANVLIENQLDKSDHRHLGQILTYVAGLEAKTVVWVAPAFREAHLAAIRWLNQNTHEEFAFFAIRLRVVQIGASPLAPLFDVLEQPNAWERRLQSETRAAKAMGETGLARKAFWTRFFESYPEHTKDGTAGGNSTLWRRCASGLVISYYLYREGVGLFVRGADGVPLDEVVRKMAPMLPQLEQALSVKFGDNAKHGVLDDWMKGDFKDPGQFDGLASWLNARVTMYAATLDQFFKGDE